MTFTVAGALCTIAVAYRASQRYLAAPFWPGQADMARPLREAVTAAEAVDSGARGLAQTDQSPQRGDYEGGRWHLLAVLEELSRMAEAAPSQRHNVESLRASVGRLLDRAALVGRAGQTGTVPPLAAAGAGAAVEEIRARARDMADEDRRVWSECRARSRRAKQEAAGASLASALLVFAALLLWIRALRRETVSLAEMADRLISSEARFRHLVEHTTDLIVLHDVDGGLQYVSPSVRALLGLSPEEVTGTGLGSLVHPDDRETVARYMDDVMTSRDWRAVVRFRLRDHAGTYRWFDRRTFVITDPTSGSSLIQSTLRDIDDQVNAEESMARNREELRALSLCDELTGLGNRRAFVTLASQQLKLTARTRRKPAVLFIDLDSMKSINDILGHQAGDEALKDTARLLRETFRDSDILARLGGDEFAVMAYDARFDEGPFVCERLRAAVERHNRSAGRQYRVSLSIGVAEYDPDQPVSIENLLAIADRRMYEDKRARASGTEPSVSRAVRPRATRPSDA